MKRRLFLFLALIVLLSGCSFIKKAHRYDDLEQENISLRNRLKQFGQEKNAALSQVEEKERELSGLEQARLELENKLKEEIGKYEAKLQMTERGLVITFLSEVFFDPGRDIIRSKGEDALSRVAGVLNREAGGSFVAVEGHTDSDPIKRSGWKSNWELSSARALAVLHFLIDKCEVNPRRLSIAGYGQYRPVAPNDSVENKQQNRRVEIVILPSGIKKVKD